MLDTLDPTATRTGEPPRTATRVPIGRHATGTLDLDLDRLLAGRMLLQGGSGAGKSRTMRRIVAQMAALDQPWNCPHGRRVRRGGAARRGAEKARRGGGRGAARRGVALRSALRRRGDETIERRERRAA